GELWASDGTNAGTKLLHIFPNGSDVRGATAFGDNITFSVTGVGADSLWISDGTDRGTKQLASDVEKFTILGSRILFDKRVDSGIELWTSAGTPNSNQRILLLPNSSSALVAEMTTVGGRVLFGLSHDTNRPKPWVTDG